MRILVPTPVLHNATVNLQNTRTAFAYKNKKELRRTYMVYRFLKYPWLVKAAGLVCIFALKIRLPVSWLIRKTIYPVFCAGRTALEAGEIVGSLSCLKVDAVLDYAVESSSGHVRCNKVRNEIMYNIKTIPGLRFVSVKMSGLVPATVLEKKQAGQTLTQKETEALAKGFEAADAICSVAQQFGVSVFLDAEESWIQGPIDELALKLMRDYNRQKAVVYNTFQLYRTGQLESINNFVYDAVEHDYIAGIKIVRGAYLEKERRRAEKKGYPSPVFQHKNDTDANFDEAMKFCMRYLDICELCIATHNEESTRLAVSIMNTSVSDRERSHVHFSQLYGMSDNLTFNLAAAGFQASKYLPYGRVRVVMPYLIRRAEENTAIAGQMGRELSLLSTEIQRRNMI